ncbi:hypothetical protein CEXT_749911 [Caerostris extrusa]|uniref:Uncharacterized protein n=1 Tax=Caerostris extrusa TaxID=172846 RepID=A0AAV4XP50_CAEEX|nr:hypothetical protein CEXT_749911 [Caerostris extrusa]
MHVCSDTSQLQLGSMTGCVSLEAETEPIATSERQACDTSQLQLGSTTELRLTRSRDRDDCNFRELLRDF